VALRALAALVVGGAVLLGVGAAAGPAAAHGGAAVMELLSDVEVGAGVTEVRVAVTHEADGHPAEGAILDAVGAGPGGAATPAVRLERTGDVGVYAAPLELATPGRWELTLTSSFPPGTLVVPVAVAEAGPATTAGPAVASTAPPSSTTTEPPVAGLEEPEAGGAEGGSDRTNLVIAAVSGILGGGLGLWASRRRARRRG
jgi:hypothetical protein